MTNRYATLEEMRNMQFGVTGRVVTIDKGWGPAQFEMLVGYDDDTQTDLFGWAARANDENGDMVDWDRVSEDDARELGLIK